MVERKGGKEEEEEGGGGTEPPNSPEQLNNGKVAGQKKETEQTVHEIKGFLENSSTNSFLKQ